MSSSRVEKSLIAELERLKAKLQIANFRVIDIENAMARVEDAISALKVKK